MKPDFVVDVTEFAERKIQALRAFQSQFYDPNSVEPNTPISGKEFFEVIKGRMADMGRQANFIYAEGFTVERYIGVQDLFDLE